MKKLKLMVADMAKYITALREKGKTLFDSYLVLRKHLNEMTATLKNFQTQVAESKEKVKELRKELEAWRAKSRYLQAMGNILLCWQRTLYTIQEFLILWFPESCSKALTN